MAVLLQSWTQWKKMPNAIHRTQLQWQSRLVAMSFTNKRWNTPLLVEQAENRTVWCSPELALTWRRMIILFRNHNDPDIQPIVCNSNRLHRNPRRFSTCLWKNINKKLFRNFDTFDEFLTRALYSVRLQPFRWVALQLYRRSNLLCELPSKQLKLKSGK